MGDKEQVGPESVEAGLRAIYGRKRNDASVAADLGFDSVVLREAPEDVSPAVEPGGHVKVDDRRYEILGELARGGVGIVLKSRDNDLSRDVAIKVLREEYADNAEVIERFVEEAQIGGQLQHPGIVPVYGLGLQPDGRPYFAMKLVKGRTLGETLAERKDPSENRRHYIGIFEQICQTVAYAHALGVIHRDLKPANVMVGAFGEVQVVDWGFAKVLERKRERAPDEETVATLRSTEGSAQSIVGSVLGTPAYMPPEQAMGQVDELDERADVFSLGGILCEILTGKPPYFGDSGLHTMAMQGNLDHARERLAACGAEEDLIALASACLSPAVADRPRDAGAVSDEIHAQLAAAEERARKAELAAAEELAKELEEQARLAEQLAEAKEEEARVEAQKHEAAKERARQQDERRRMEFEKKARTRSLAVAAALLIAVAVGVGGLLWSQGEAAAREREIQGKVSDALQKVSELEGKTEWPKAFAAAKAALNVARDADAETQERVRSVVDDIKTKKADAEAKARRRAEDDLLLASLHSDLHMNIKSSWGAFDADTVALFLKHGIDVSKPAAAIARISSSAHPKEIAAVFDQWSLTRRTEHALRGGDWETLVRIAKEADPNPLRNRLRDAAVASDAPELKAIMSEVDAQNPSVWTRIMLGATLYENGEFRDALEVLRKGARLHPDQAHLHIVLAIVLNSFEPPLTQEATRHGAVLLALRPEATLVRLIAAFFRADWDTAIRICEEEIKKDHDNALMWMELGTALVHKGDSQRAVAAFRKTIALDPLNFRAWRSLAEALFKSGDRERALAAVRKSGDALPLTPRVRAFGLASFGEYHSMSGEHEKAIAKAAEAVQVAPGYAEAYWYLGGILRRAGKVKRAADALRKAIELEPSPVAHAHLAIVLQDDDPDEALSHLLEAVKLDPKPAHRIALARLHLWRRGDPDRALSAVDPVLRADPAHEQAKTVRSNARWMKGLPSSGARHHMSRREYAKALDALQKDPSPRARGLAGACLMHLGKFAEGLKELYACIEHEPPKGADERYHAAFRNRVLEWIDVCERVVPFKAQTDAIVKGKLRALRPAEAVAYADLCYFAGSFAWATVHYKEAHAALADRYDRERAAYASAQSGAKARPYALGLLEAELEELKQRDDTAAVRHVLWEWKRTPLLAPVRDPLPLARLRDNERDGWVPFWKNVDALLEAK